MTDLTNSINPPPDLDDPQSKADAVEMASADLPVVWEAMSWSSNSETTE